MPIEDIIEDNDVDNLAVVDLSGGRRNPMEGGGGGVGGAIASPLKAFYFRSFVFERRICFFWISDCVASSFFFVLET